MGRTTRAMGRMLQNMFVNAGYDITIEQWVIIVNLNRQNSQFQQQLADNTYKNKTSVTRMITSLQKRGLVERIPDTDDLRQNRIFLTDKGRQLYSELAPLARQVQQKATMGIQPGELESCMKIVLKIYGNIREE
ncbi:MAG: MarR family transcriptional regulator [Deltaproteobacteria bacterium]|nr:MarR family transcriptional regulator [Deltaproteobacteria bacterium]